MGISFLLIGFRVLVLNYVLLGDKLVRDNVELAKDCQVILQFLPKAHLHEYIGLHLLSDKTKLLSTHLFALFEDLVGFMNSSSHLLVLQLTKLALWVPQPGHHASR